MIQIDRKFAWLADMAFNDYSQFGEDGVLQAIFSAIGPANEWCFECGAADGLFFSNTRRLIESGWRGVLVEADGSAFERLVENTERFGDHVACINRLIDASHRIDGILYSAGAPLDIDLAVIDVDGQDYYLFNSILQYRPRVVMIEFDQNADEDFIPTLGGPGQAGSRAISKLANGKFYDLVFANRINLIFVQKHLAHLIRFGREEILQRDNMQ
jgi:hypothetical protein